MRIKLFENDIFHKESEYGTIRIRIGCIDEKPAVVLMVDEGCESARYLDDEMEDEIAFDYMERFSYAFFVNPNIKKAFMIGGGGFSYPQYYVNTYKDAEITVAEISKDILSVAYQYFGLKDLPEENAKRLHVLNQDGIEWLKTHDEKYDLIINDAFIGTFQQALDGDSTQIIHDHLNPDGIYIINVLSSITGEKAEALEYSQANVNEHFQHSVSMIVDEEIDPDTLQNIILFASDTEFI